MKIKVGIVGYGNLGKSIEKLLKGDNRFELVKIFTRADTMKKGALNLKEMAKWRDKIDLLFLCVGSKSCIESMAIPLSKYFNLVDAYDNHKKIPLYLKGMDESLKKHNRSAICCVGWDPGLFSLMRLILNSVEGNAFTFWGKGVSQGHTQALKEVEGVKAAVQYTLPNKKLIKLIKEGRYKPSNKQAFHSRLCYVVADGDKRAIKNKIVGMPDYFKGYKTKVKFVKKLDSVKMYHAGQVLTLGDSMNFSVKMESNPLFTAKIMIAFAVALNALYTDKQFGAFTIADLPLRYLDPDYKKFV